MAGCSTHHNTIQKNFLFLTQNIDLANSDLWQVLIQEEIISPVQYEAIVDQFKPNNQQVTGLLRHLSHQSREVFDQFIQCLAEHHHPHVAKHIQDYECQHITQHTEDMQRPYVLFISGLGAEDDAGATAFLRILKQNLHYIDPQIISEIVQSSANASEARAPTHVVKLLPGNESSNHSDQMNSSCVVYLAPEMYWRNKEEPMQADGCRKTHLAVDKSRANLFVGKSVFAPWKKYLEKGDKNVIYYPSYICQDKGLNQSPSEAPFDIVIELDETKRDAMANLKIVLDAIPKKYLSVRMRVRVLMATGQNFKTDVIDKITKYTKFFEIIELRYAAQAKKLMENAVWILSGLGKVLTWLRMIPINHGIPHIVWKESDLNFAYADLNPCITTKFVLDSFSSSELEKKLEWILNNKDESYTLAGKLSEEFALSRKVRIGHAEFLLSCLGDYVATILVRGPWKREYDVLVNLLDEMTTFTKFQARQTTDKTRIFGSLGKQIGKILGNIISVEKSSIALRTYVPNPAALQQIKLNIETGVAAKTLRNVLHHAQRYLGLECMSLTQLHIIFYPPKIFLNNDACITEKGTTFLQDYRTQGEILIAAVRKCNVEMVNGCIEEGSDVNYENEDGRTPLMEASTYGPEAVEVVKVLVCHGALDLDFTNEQSTTLYEYLHGGENNDRWLKFIDYLNKHSPSHWTKNIELHMSESFAETPSGEPAASLFKECPAPSLRRKRPQHTYPRPDLFKLSTRGATSLSYRKAKPKSTKVVCHPSTVKVSGKKFKGGTKAKATTKSSSRRPVTSVVSRTTIKIGITDPAVSSEGASSFSHEKAKST